MFNYYDKMGKSKEGVKSLLSSLHKEVREVFINSGSCHNFILADYKQGKSRFGKPELSRLRTFKNTACYAAIGKTSDMAHVKYVAVVYKQMGDRLSKENCLWFYRKMLDEKTSPWASAIKIAKPKVVLCRETGYVAGVIFRNIDKIPAALLVNFMIGLRLAYEYPRQVMLIREACTSGASFELATFLSHFVQRGENKRTCFMFDYAGGHRPLNSQAFFSVFTKHEPITKHVEEKPLTNGAGYGYNTDAMWCSGQRKTGNLAIIYKFFKDLPVTGESKEKKESGYVSAFVLARSKSLGGGSIFYLPKDKKLWLELETKLMEA